MNAEDDHPMTVRGLALDPVTNAPIVILKAEGGTRLLPIWIGLFEANAIAIEMEKIVAPRPMTHDLLKNMIELLNARMDRIVVEWCVTYGPKVFVYPAVKRIIGFDTCEGSGDGTSDERWADLLEFEYVPQVVKALEGAGYRVQTICADQRPIQTMRQRRRDTEKLAASRGAHHGHH